MKKYNFLVIAMFTCLLTACATSQADRIIDQSAVTATQNAENNDFHVILKAAQGGDKNAQYAIGYMYYYGKGVEQDIARGESWIKKAALNGQVQALQAVQLLDVSTGAIEKNHAKVDAAKKSASLHLERKLINQHSIAVKQQTVLSGKEAKQFFAKHKKALYTLQIYGGFEQKQVMQVANKYVKYMKQPLIVYLSKYKGKPWYVCLVGAYVDFHEAKAKIKVMPNALKKLHPWVKSIRSLDHDK